ncbi:hypothetical protein N8I77_010473 [Diaporthe amygdali]|uniref:RRM domain-containing protein n=1 Tax=Phomopsis amygdali TaxID=1214568 RepID=A0AAD9W117_PHOAM|nr:hypothetical protein N8I77_010473 [Diaporthe amygdali]
MASLSRSCEPSPERLKHNKGATLTGSDRAPSPSEMSSAGDSDVGGARLDTLSICDSPKYTPPHARHGIGSSRSAQAVRTAGNESPTCRVRADDRDDVFVSSPVKTLRERRSERSVMTGKMQCLDVALANEDHTLRTRASNLNTRHQINGVDAQNLYPPTACVFVANLPEPKDDTALEAAIYGEFNKYGKCWVKIRRDSHHMPFAFVQFTSDEEARSALESGKGAIIYGRPCRTEMVKANRTFIVQKKSGAPITVDEVTNTLLPYGSLSKCELLSPQLREPLGFPPTVLVEFSMFDATRDLHTAFRHDPVYTVTAFDLKKNCVATRDSGDEAFLAACERDRRSAFVGDLPAHVTQGDLEDLFATAGEVLKVNVIQKPSNSGMVRTMAFIEYSQPDMPELAISKFHGSVLKGAVIRVERKSVKERGPTPRHSRSQLLIRQPEDSPIARGPPKSPGVQIVSTPTRPNATSTEMSPAPVPPPMYGGWGYGMPNSPYAQQHYAAGYGVQSGASGMPMTPQTTPQMSSPWTYYHSYWPGMMGYDPSTFYMSPYAFQSPTPMTGNRTEDTKGQSTPTRNGHVAANNVIGNGHQED